MPMKTTINMSIFNSLTNIIDEELEDLKKDEVILNEFAIKSRTKSNKFFFEDYVSITNR